MDVCDVAAGGYKDRNTSEGWGERGEYTLWMCVMLQLVNVETGLPVKVGEMGEYCVDGPQKMIGYLHNKEATDEMIDKDGWLHTGALSLFIWLFPPPSPFFCTLFFIFFLFLPLLNEDGKHLSPFTKSFMN